MPLQAIEYEALGRRYTGFLADPGGDARVPGVLVAHEGAGLTDHPKGVAERLAGLGYAAFALDLFGDPEMSLEDRMALVRRLRADKAELRGRTAAAFDVLRAHPEVDPERMAAIGYCFGGTAVIELARSGAPLRAVVGFHSGLTVGSQEENAAIRAPILLCLGADDPVVTADQRAAFAAEMADAGVDWQIHLYGGVAHSFTNPEIDSWSYPGFRYDAKADARSWAAMRHFLEERL
jgi:dienelactone hydrolase